MIGLTIDMAPIIRMVDLMNEVGETVSARTNEGKKLRAMIVEAVHEGLRSDLQREAEKNVKNIAHVYEWGHKITDRSSISRNLAGESIIDHTNEFKADPQKDTPLWDMILSESKSYIKFYRNDQWAYYDMAVYKIPMRKPRSLGKHVFDDQAEHLESTKKIIKDSADESPYRTNSYGKWAPPRTPRIQQLSNGRLMLFDSYERKNEFYRQFYKFFESYKAEKLPGMGQRVVSNMDVDFQRVLDKEISVQQAKSLAALAITPSSAAGVGVTFRGESGRLIFRMPQPKNHGKVTKGMQNAAKKQAEKQRSKARKKVVKPK